MTVNLGETVDFFGTIIRAECETLEHSSSYRITVYDETIILIVTRLRCRSNHAIETIGHFTTGDCRVIHGLTNGRLAVTQLMLIGAIARSDISGHVADTLF